MPLLSPSSVLLLSGGFSASYLSSIYLIPSARVQHPSTSPTSKNDPADISIPPPTKKDRNHPSIIKSRLIAVSISSLSSLLSIPLILSHHSTPKQSYLESIPQALRLSGFVLPSDWKETVRMLSYPVGLTMSLFAGSLYVQYLEGDLPFVQRGGSWKRLKDKFDGWRGIRNFIVAPLTEEITFRSCVVGISYLGGWNKKQLVFLTPLWFGLAHVHHASESYLAGGRTQKALIQGCLVSTFQFAYTTLFGWYATYLFLRTGSIIPPFLAHAFCNSMGLPPLSYALQVYPNKKLSIWTSYLGGIGLFVYGFWRWTEPGLFGGSLYWL